ncbi:LytTR family DNA-binding domain-containing protein [Mucilaginibacter sp. PAMB04274]|uniref:LytR/AlgR family response regulator transcription factor n=1 Tax=Mucilaginibacter sp. PAMB04274 TaxID=3138568 RepID=UPI0031F621CC
MLLKCIAIDKEPLALQLLKEYVCRFASLQMVQVFDNAITGAKFLEGNPVDLLFIDVNVIDTSSINIIKSLQHKPVIIFTTAHQNPDLKGFDLEAFDYLLKPIEFKQFGKVIEEARAYHEYKTSLNKAHEEQCVYVYSAYRMIKINLQDIEYIETQHDYIKFHLLSHPKSILTFTSLKTVLEQLPETHFKKIHHNYIVAVNHIRCIQNRKVRLTNTELPLSDIYSQILPEWKKNSL